MCKSNPALKIARERAQTQLLVTKAVFRARESETKPSELSQNPALAIARQRIRQLYPQLRQIFNEKGNL